MRIDIITVLPEMIEGFVHESILARAEKKGLAQIRLHNLRDYTLDKWRRVDDYPYGGSAGMVMRRDTLEKETRPLEGIVEYVEQLLDDIQKNIFEKARKYRDERVYECENYEEFKERVKDGGFFLCHWDGTAETEAQIKEETQATIRCVPFAYEQTPGVDMVSGKPSKHRVIIARSY